MSESKHSRLLPCSNKTGFRPENHCYPKSRHRCQLPSRIPAVQRYPHLRAVAWFADCLSGMFAGRRAGRRRAHQGPRLSPALSAAVVIVLPLIAMGVLLVNAKGMAFGERLHREEIESFAVPVRSVQKGAGVAKKRGASR
jgi:hypothetical protein